LFEAKAFQDLNAYFAAWRDALVKELRAYKGAVLYCVNAIRARRRDEARFLAMTHRKARAPATRRASSPRRIARRARPARGGATPSAWHAIGQRRIEPSAARPFVSLNLNKSTAPHRGLWRTR
jgi:hypothetical protein